MDIVSSSSHYLRPHGRDVAAPRTLDRLILRTLRTHPRPTVDQVAVAAGCDPSDVRKLLSRCRNFRRGRMRYMMRRLETLDLDEHAASGLANDSLTPPRIVGWLATHRSTSVRELAVGNSNCPQGALKAAAGDQHLRVRRAVATNKHTPSATLRLLAQAEATRRIVARNHSAPSALLARLAARGDFHTRLDVAHNPSCPPDAVRRLAADPHKNVRCVIAGRDDCTVEDLRRLAGEEEFNVLRSVAANSRCPPDELRRLATASDDEVRRLVVGNPGTPPDVLATLTDDLNHDVRVAALRRSRP